MATSAPAVTETVRSRCWLLAVVLANIVLETGVGQEVWEEEVMAGRRRREDRKVNKVLMFPLIIKRNIWERWSGILLVVAVWRH